MSESPLKKGNELQGFIIDEITCLNELNITLFQLRHKKTGAHLVHLASEDTNNLFGVGFKTPPADSTGVAHILEHTVLCGSKTYPVRDPFFAMLKRSLNTFMNALTASDWTFYPFSSQNTKDFYNLMGIYLDAVFFPLIREQDFRQEGHRVEFLEPDNPDSPLGFKGVVYNEMKGAMADPSSLLNRRLGKALYPTTCYRHNSGGEPSEIPNLSWQQLREFHASFYHPSNSFFFTYGDLPLERHLKVIKEKALQHFEAREVHSEVSLEKYIQGPAKVTETFPLDPGESPDKKSMVHMAWLTCDIADSFDRLALNLLSSLLLGNPAAPLYKALLDCGLGSNLSPGTGYQEDNRTTYFAAGLQGTDPDEAQRIEEVILSTLENVAQTGFSKERIEGAMHRLEFHHREVTGGHYPYPLSLLFRIVGPWLHNNDPVSPLLLDENLKRLRRAIAGESFFENLIRRYLLNNKHRITLILKPDQAQKAREDKDEIARLEQIKKSLSEEKLKDLVVQARELQKAQEAKDDISCLPTLTREDIPAKEPEIPYEFKKEGMHNVQWFNQPTNGIGYFMAHMPTGHLPEELLPLVPLFCTLLTQVGAAGYSYVEMAERKEAGTGGIQAGSETLENPDDFNDFSSVIKLKGKALIRKQDQLFSILSDICKAPDFTDLKRLHTVIGQMKISLENSIPSSGHTYALRAGASCLTPAAKLREQWSGLTQIRMIRRIAALKAEELGEFSQKMQRIAQMLLNKNNIRCGITAEARNFASINEPLKQFLKNLPEGPSSLPSEMAFTPCPSRMGWAASVPVSYVTQVFRAVPFTHPDSAPLMVLAKLLRASFLHREIREKGGAYGGFASYNAEGGLFSMLSYRDPQLARTIRVYDEAIDWATAGDFDEKEITEATLAVFSELDRPLSPGGKGNQEFANTQQGLTIEMRQKLRERALSVSRDDLTRVAIKYLREGKADSTISVLSSEEALLKANEELGEKRLKIERV